MGSDAKLWVLFVALHLIGLALGGVLLVMFLRSDTVTPWSPPKDDGDDGRGNEPASPAPGGGPDTSGVPLPDAAPARVRLREPARLGHLLPARDRRPAHRPSPAPARRTRQR